MDIFIIVILLFVHIAIAESGLQVINSYTGMDTALVILYIIRTIVTQIVTIVLILYLADDLDKN